MCRKLCAHPSHAQSVLLGALLAWRAVQVSMQDDAKKLEELMELQGTLAALSACGRVWVAPSHGVRMQVVHSG